MAIVFRNTDRRYGFTWDTAAQPPARWHGTGEGPVQYFADTPDGAWAEFLRHEGIIDEADLAGVIRRIWAVEVADAVVEGAATPDLAMPVTQGGLETYGECQREAARLRAGGAVSLVAPSAALDDASGYRAGAVGVRAAARRSKTLVLFGPADTTTGWMCHDSGLPDPTLLSRVRPLHT